MMFKTVSVVAALRGMKGPRTRDVGEDEGGIRYKGRTVDRGRHPSEI